MSVQKITMSQNLFLYLKLKICFLSFILAQMTFDLKHQCNDGQFWTMFLLQEISKLLRATVGWEVGNKEKIRLTKLATWDWQMLLGGWQQLLLQNKNVNLETDKCFCKPNQMQICAPATRRKWAVRWASDNVGRKKILFCNKSSNQHRLVVLM